MLNTNNNNVNVNRAKLAAADDPQRLRQAVKQFIGMADRKDMLFADLLLSIVKRIEKLESKDLTT